MLAPVSVIVISACWLLEAGAWLDDAGLLEDAGAWLDDAGLLDEEAAGAWLEEEAGVEACSEAGVDSPWFWLVSAGFDSSGFDSAGLPHDAKIMVAERSMRAESFFIFFSFWVFTE